MRDQFGRSIEYLRISVTDRCNFRCQYCMPVEGLPWLPKQEILRYEEIVEVVRQLAPLGLRRLRITGGEPTIRPDLVTLVAQLKAIDGVEDIALSTNGVKLPAMAQELARAGLDRVNISADSLRPERVAEVEYDQMEGIAWRWQSIDGAMVKAPLAQEAVGSNPTDRGESRQQAASAGRRPWRPVAARRHRSQRA